MTKIKSFKLTRTFIRTEVYVVDAPYLERAIHNFEDEKDHYEDERLLSQDEKIEYKVEASE